LLIVIVDREKRMRIKNEAGVALIASLLILVLLGALLECFIISVNSDQQLIGIDREQNRAFYGAQAGLEQLTADLGTLFENNYAPSAIQINALTTSPPSIPNISYVSPGGGSGYRITFPQDAQGKALATTRTIPSGPYEGLVGLITPYTMTATAHTPSSAEVRMQRSLQTVAVPVFQFGIFSETDLSFFAGPNFDFGGRVHTNGNLFLAEGNGNTLTMRDRVTAVGEVVRTNLNNGWNTSSNYTGTVRAATAPGAFRNLATTEGSLVGTLGSALNDPTWTNLSIGTYNGNVRSGRTGARRMDLPLVSMGATPADLIRRPVLNENNDNPDVFAQRYFAMASLRILLSDNAADITSLPTVTATAPVRLTGNAPNGTPFALAGTSANGFRSSLNTPLIDGYIKMERQDQAGNWQDVTNEILGFGIAGRDLASVCADQPNAIIRFQRLKDAPTTPACGGAATQYWPNVLYDTREGVFRDNIPADRYEVYLGGVMHYIELDINNLSRWFRGVIGASGSSAINTTGYVVYFSDRRTNRNAANQETAEYGFEDNVNLTDVANGLPNNVLDQGEDVNGNGVLDTYGNVPRLPAGAASPLDANARPWNYAGVTATIARKNRPIFFRRALKLVNGSTINLGNDGTVPYGLAVTSENAVYVQGNYNVPLVNPTFDSPHVATSVIADAVTLLSNSWNDLNSFNCPHTLAATCNGTKPGRIADTTWYRMAIIAGKGMPFPHPNTLYQDFGTDGGVHNFLRFLENWDNKTLNYRGSIVSLFFNRQATGIYKYNNTPIVYTPPSRGYNFDVEFLQPSLLPPRTPMFRDVNITGFTRMTMPNQ
jgi:hypothetical protein